MHARGCIPYRLIWRRNVAGLLLLAGLFASACTSSRYVGAIVGKNIYVNRGFGVVARLGASDLPERWMVIDPREETKQAPIDLDANGALDVTETQRFAEPALRLYDPEAPQIRLELDIQILPRQYDDVSIDAIVATDIRALGSSTTSAQIPIDSRQISGGFSARVFEVRSGIDAQGLQIRRAVIDQMGFIAEEGVIRRQIVRATLFAPKLDERLRKDHRQFIDALVLNRKGGSTAVKEAW